MKCEECTTHALEEFLDGELDGRRAAEVEAHLAACNACAHAYERLLDEQAMYAAYERDLDFTPQALWNGVAARIAAEETRHLEARENSTAAGANLFARLRAWLAPALVAPRFSPALTAAMLVFAIGATALLMRYANQSSYTAPPTLADARTNPPAGVATHAPGGVQATPEASPSVAPRDEQAGSADELPGGANESAGDANESADGREKFRASPTPRRREAQRKSAPLPQDAAQLLVAAQNNDSVRRQRATEKLVREAEAKYLAAIKMLSEDVGRTRTRIDPQVAARFDETLAAIDRSIAETRRTVLRQRNDPVAVQYMLSAYAKKVEVMREMAALD